jgi:hypothetical protein
MNSSIVIDDVLLTAPAVGLILLDCERKLIVATLPRLPDSSRAMLHRTGNTYVVIPIATNEILATVDTMKEIIRRAG